MEPDKLRIVRNGWRTIRATFRTAIFFANVLPMFPSRPINWLTRTPVIEQLAYALAGRMVEAELYRPAGSGRHPGVVVCLGVVPFGVDHPQVPRLSSALARAGFATLLYWSPSMRDSRLDPADVGEIAQTFHWFISQPFIDTQRTGLIGTCVGGSFALLAAADPAINDKVGFVAAWAPFSSMRTLARDIASGTAPTSGGRRRWDVDQLTRKVFVRSLTDRLAPEESELLRLVMREPGGSVELEDLSNDGRAIYPLLTKLDPTAAESAFDQLPEAMRYEMNSISPIEHVSQILAPLVLISHDLDDQVIPISESRNLVAALGDRKGLSYTEFTMFQHLDPTKVKLALIPLTRELIKFFRAVYPIFRQAI